VTRPATIILICFHDIHTQGSSRVRVHAYSYPLIQCTILANRELLYKDAPRE
jgi:hypothetical protein